MNTVALCIVLHTLLTPKAFTLSEFPPPLPSGGFELVAATLAQACVLAGGTVLVLCLLVRFGLAGCEGFATALA